MRYITIYKTNVGLHIKDHDSKLSCKIERENIKIRIVKNSVNKKIYERNRRKLRYLKSKTTSQRSVSNEASIILPHSL